jgi:hypothetical protein
MYGGGRYKVKWIISKVSMLSIGSFDNKGIQETRMMLSQILQIVPSPLAGEGQGGGLTIYRTIKHTGSASPAFSISTGNISCCESMRGGFSVETAEKRSNFQLRNFRGTFT